MRTASRGPRDVREFLEGDPDPVLTHVRRAGGMGRLATHEQEDVGQEVRVRLLEQERDGVGPALGAPLAVWHERCRRIVHAVARGVRRDSLRRRSPAPSLARSEGWASAATGTGAEPDRDDWGLSALAAVLAAHGDVLCAGERRAFDALATWCEIQAVAAALGQTHKLVALRLRRGSVCRPTIAAVHRRQLHRCRTSAGARGAVARGAQRQLHRCISVGGLISGP